jgi:hypothetical protein
MGKHTKTPVSIRFSDDEKELLDEMAARHGGQAKAIIAGLEALRGRNAITPEEALTALAIEHGLDPPKRRTKKK